MFKTPHGYVNLATALGPNARTPDHATNQPAKYPSFKRCRSKTFYRFDTEEYSGIDCKDRLVNNVRASLPGASYFANNMNEGVSYSTIQIICLFGKLLSTKTEYRADSFMKVGTKMETNKVVRSSAFKRMGNPKLKNKKPPKPAVDHQSGTRVVAPGAIKTPHKPRTHRHGGKVKEQLCDVHVILLFSHLTGHWFLLDNGMLDHEYHCEEHHKHKFVKQKDCSPDEVDLMQVMYSAEISPKTIGTIMDAVRNKKGKPGTFLSRSIANASQKYREDMEVLKGMSKDWSVAKKSIWELAK